MSNSNFNITKVKVDPVSQEITELEINGKSVETGGSEANLQEVVFDLSSPLEVGNIFGDKATEVEIHPSEGYDGIEKVTIQPDGLTGYPGEGLEFQNNPIVSLSGISSEIVLEIPRGKAWTGLVTIYPQEQP